MLLQFIADLRLSQRLFLSVALMAGAMMLIIGAGYLISDNAVKRLTSVYDVTNTKMVAEVSLTKDYTRDLIGLVNKLLLGAYPWSVSEARLDEIQRDVRLNLDLLHRSSMDMDEQNLFQAVEDQTAEPDQLVGQLRTVLQNQDPKGLRRLARTLYPCVDLLGFRIQLLLNYELGRARTEVEESHAAFLKSYGSLAALMLAAAVALFLLVSGHLRRRVSEPLNRLVEGMRDIAQGDGDLTKRLDAGHHDELGQVAQAFNTFIEKLETVSEMKRDLISVVSHQLKTPVAEINGYIENMLDGLTGELAPRQRLYLEDMREIGWNNYRLINDLLSISKLERGVITVDLKPVPVKHIVDLSVRDYEKLMQRKGLDLRLEGPAEDLWVFADQDKTVETLRNVLNNAVKCTDKGYLSIRWGLDDESGWIEVKDTGIGMTPQTLSKLFSRVRVLGHEAHRSGAGLGLFIGKQFMKLQNGDIRAVSEPGVGSTFILTVPRYREQKKELERGAA